MFYIQFIRGAYFGVMLAWFFSREDFMLREKRPLLRTALMVLLCAGIITTAVALEMLAAPTGRTVPHENPKVTLTQGISIFS